MNQIDLYKNIDNLFIKGVESDKKEDIKSLIEANFDARNYFFSEAPINWITWLNENGFNIWYDQGIPLGSNWVEEIMQALENCSIFIVFVTENSVKSKTINKEVLTAVNLGKYVIPIFLEPTDLRKDWQFLFVDLQFIKRFDLDEQQFRSKVLEIVKKRLGDL